jgi:hypothetical protein
VAERVLARRQPPEKRHELFLGHREHPAEFRHGVGMLIDAQIEGGVGGLAIDDVERRRLATALVAAGGLPRLERAEQSASR